MLNAIWFVGDWITFTRNGKRYDGPISWIFREEGTFLVDTDIGQVRVKEIEATRIDPPTWV